MINPFLIYLIWCHFEGQRRPEGLRYSHRSRVADVGWDNARMTAQDKKICPRGQELPEPKENQLKLSHGNMWGDKLFWTYKPPSLSWFYTVVVSTDRKDLLSDVFSFLCWQIRRQQRFLKCLSFRIYRAGCIYIFPGNEKSRSFSVTSVCAGGENQESASVLGLGVVDRRAGGCWWAGFLSDLCCCGPSALASHSSLPNAADRHGEQPRLLAAPQTTTCWTPAVSE